MAEIVVVVKFGSWHFRCPPWLCWLMLWDSPPNLKINYSDSRLFGYVFFSNELFFQLFLPVLLKMLKEVAGECWLMGCVMGLGYGC